MQLDFTEISRLTQEALATRYAQSFDCILFIGDPHVSSRRPGRRKDDYLASVIAKLEACAQMCREFNALPIILGDLFHRNDDNSLVMLNRLTAVLRKFPVPPLSLEGNHDKEQTSLSENDALFLLAQSGVLTVVLEAGMVKDFVVQNAPARLYACPYGAPIPKELEAGEGATLLITHHDMAFSGAYPGSLPIAEVKGVDMVVNGHMHDTKPSIKAGCTNWHNPGNIEPLSVDHIGHVPRAWLWDNTQTAELVGLELPHGDDLFDLTGIQVKASEAEAAVSRYTEDSKFAGLIAQEATEDLNAERTDDASVLQTDMAQVFAAGAVSAPTQALLASLLGELVVGLEAA